MADPQHPAVPFEQAVDLLTGEPRQRSQHPDIAALAVETVSGWIAARNVNRVFDADLQDLRQRVEAALRTLARPVEDEEVPNAEERALAVARAIDEKIHVCMCDKELQSCANLIATAIQEEAHVASARLAREKASAERRIDEFDCCMCGSPMSAHDMGSNHAPVSMYDYRLSQADARATRAEQEIARLRGELEKIAAFAPGNGDVCEIIAKIARSALAAAAGAEEPR